MKVIFIAGPLTTGGDGSPKNIRKNIQNTVEYQIALANAGINFFCPHTHTAAHHHHPKRAAAEEFYYKADLEILRKVADAMIALPGWEKSAGTRKEVEIAKQLNIPVFCPKSPDDLKEVIEWSKEKES